MKLVLLMSTIANRKTDYVHSEVNGLFKIMIMNQIMNKLMHNVISMLVYYNYRLLII